MPQQRRYIVAGNWKMNLTRRECNSLIDNLESALKTQPLNPNVQLIIAPSFIHLAKVSDKVKSLGLPISIAAQNCSSFEKGAYTGEVSLEMLKSYGINYIIIGHSERREYFKESYEVLAKKVSLSLKYGLKPIFCCGEILEQREAGQQDKIIAQQLKKSLFHLSESEIKKVIIAYEPVWAIGTGKTASVEQAQTVHAFIRGLLAKNYSPSLSENTQILYGGSCKPNNARELFASSDIDGGLIGGASLKADDFIKIAQSQV